MRNSCTYWSRQRRRRKCSAAIRPWVGVRVRLGVGWLIHVRPISVSQAPITNIKLTRVYAGSENTQDTERGDTDRPMRYDLDREYKLRLMFKV